MIDVLFSFFQLHLAGVSKDSMNDYEENSKGSSLGNSFCSFEIVSTSVFFNVT